MIQAETSGRLRWGLLSTAGINRALIGPIREAERSDLVAVSSRTQSRADAYAREWEIPTAYGSYEALLEDAEVDVVYISLPNTLHAEWTVKAAEAGKHVLCEKPIVLTLADLARIEAAAADNGVMVFEAFMYLHHPQTLKVAAMIREGRIGKVQLIQSWFSFYLPAEHSDNIRLSPDLGGGALWDVGVYPTSMAVTMAQAGPPAEIWAQQIVGETGVDVTLSGQLRFENSVTGQVSCSFRMPFRQGTVVVGDEGSIALPSPWKPGVDGEESCILLTPRSGAEEEIVIEPVDPYLCEVEAMEACVLDGADPIISLSRSREILRAVLGLYHSARSESLVAV